MKTRLIAFSALAAVGALAAGLLPVAPAGAQEVITSLSITKIVTGAGPQTDYPFELVCDEEDTNSFTLDSGETVGYDSDFVDFAQGEECVLTETDAQGAGDIDAIVTASDGTEVPSVATPSGDGVSFTFTTLEDPELDYGVVVFNAFPAGDGDICPSVDALGTSLVAVLEQVAGGGDLTPAELETLWTGFTQFFLDALAVVPEDQIGAFQTTALAFVLIGNILEPDWDIDALNPEDQLQITEIFSSAEFGISEVDTYIATACAPVVTTTTTTAAADPVVTAPRFTG